MTLLIIFFLLSITFSFLCSIWEAVLLSITPSFIEQAKEKNGRSAEILGEFKENIDRPLAAILTLNTIAHTVGAIGVGAQAGKLWSENHWEFLGITLSAEALVASAMTLAILILSEIIPKTIGANNWQNMAGFTARSVNIVIYALWPLVWLAQWLTRQMKSETTKSVFSRGDLSAMASIGVKSGSLNEDEYRLLQNVLTFRTIHVNEIMTPRTVLVTAQRDMTIKEFYESDLGKNFSRIPIYTKTVDDSSQYILKHEAFKAMIEGKGEEKLASIGRDLLFVEDNNVISVALEKMIDNKEHIMRVVGPFGGTHGILTLEDIIETLLGLEILDEVDTTADLQELAKEKWQKKKIEGAE